MKHGFVKVAAVTPKIKVADTTYNGALIRKHMDEACEKGAKVVVFPELCITGYTCQDLFLQDTLIDKAKEELVRIAEHSKKLDGIFFVGLPLDINGNLYNVAAAVAGGDILGIVPKTYLPNYNEFYEARHFRSGADMDTSYELATLMRQKSIIPMPPTVTARAISDRRSPPQWGQIFFLHVLTCHS